MATKKKSVKVIKSAASLKAVDSAVASLADMATATTKAVAAVGKENKKLLTEAKRLNKKRATLMRKKKSAKAKLTREPNATNKKAVTALDKEIAANRKDAAKVAAQKTGVSAELTALKTASKRAVSYTKAVISTDKVLNKPKKKVRRKKVA